MCFPVGQSSRCRFVGTSDRVYHDRLNKHPACGVVESLEWNEAVGFNPDTPWQAESEKYDACVICVLGDIHRHAR